MDLESIDALCEALRDFDGGVIVVTHDARLIGACDCKLWVLGDQDVVEYEGGFAQYRQEILDDLSARAVVEEQRLQEKAEKRLEMMEKRKAAIKKTTTST